MDRFGVPQYGGDPDQFEEYCERAWDLWHGRQGSENQAATPVHLRSGLQGAAYEAVRLIKHDKLMTCDAQSKPTDVGLKHFLSTLQESIAAEKPVKVNELFFVAFYSPSVWRRSTESMQQYIVRREQDFKRLEDVLPDSKIPEHIRAMMLLAFGGLDPKEQLSVLSSVNNEYDFKKISHALRIQFPNATGKAVFRRDYLGCGRSTPAPATPGMMRFKPRAPSKGRGKGKGYALAVAEAIPEDMEDYENDAYFEDPDGGEADEANTAGEFYDSTADNLEAMLQDFDLEDEELADAFATIMQRKKKPPSSAGKGQPMPFRATGEMSFDKARESKRSAIRFLKQVTPCTACGQKGHWNGDDQCPKKREKTGKGGTSPNKLRTASPKKGAKTSYFVLPEGNGEDNESESYVVHESTPENFVIPVSFLDLVPSFRGTFSNISELTVEAYEALVVVPLSEQVCEHSVYRAGEEKKYQRAANGHTRSVSCKEPECDKTVVSARRKEPVQLWKFLVVVALCTKWGRRARSRALSQYVAKVRADYLEEKETEERRAREIHLLVRGASPKSSATGSRQPPGWTLVQDESEAGSPASSAYPTAKIIRPGAITPRAWVYGVCIAADTELPPFPGLAEEDQDIIAVPPNDLCQCGPETPFSGMSYA